MILQFLIQKEQGKKARRKDGRKEKEINPTE